MKLHLICIKIVILKKKFLNFSAFQIDSGYSQLKFVIFHTKPYNGVNCPINFEAYKPQKQNFICEFICGSPLWFFSPFA